MPCIRRALVVALPLVTVFGAGVAVGAQPHMTNALQALQTARSELLLASPNKGGHRDQAIELVNRAINQVQLGINYAAGR
jgi:hypothetical protein